MDRPGHWFMLGAFLVMLGQSWLGGVDLSHVCRWLGEYRSSSDLPEMANRSIDGFCTGRRPDDN
jgi:hypothetical protein